MLIVRSTSSQIERALARQASVVLVGPRQVRKTTLGLQIAEGRPAAYIDLEQPNNQRVLDEPAHFFEQHAESLVILDEVHRVPEVFSVIRGTIDRARRQGRQTGMFLFLGSASMELLGQSSESLAGRIAMVELDTINVLEAHTAGIDQTQLWMRGGFPLSLTAASLQDSFEWRSDFIRTYLERDIPSFAKGANVSLLDNLWTMLSYAQGSILNLSSLSRSLGVSSPTVQHYIDLLEKLLMIRLIHPFHANIKKRYVKSPKVFIRDSGLAHAQLGLMTDVQILGHPIVGHSWEGFVIENILSVAPPRSRYGFYRTAFRELADVDPLCLFHPQGFEVSSDQTASDLDWQNSPHSRDGGSIRTTPVRHVNLLRRSNDSLTRTPTLDHKFELAFPSRDSPPIKPSRTAVRK